MGGEGSIAGIITALRNNANMQLNRKHFFNKKEKRISSNENVKIKMRHTERSPAQIQEFRKNLKAQKRKEVARMIIALIVAVGFIALVGYLFYAVF